MKLNDLINKLNELYPENLKCDFDNVGLMVGDREKEINKIYFCLDLTKECLDEAINNNADLIITHHPLLFNPLKRIDKKDDIGNIIYSLIKKDICVYSMHTNFDKVCMNEFLGRLIGINNMSVLNVKENMGIIGDIEETEVYEYIKLVKEKFDISEAYYYGENIKVKKVALVAGSGSSFYFDAYINGADLFITGDLSYSRALEAKRLGLNILDCGHFIEKLFYVPVIEEINKISNIECIVSSINPKPYEIM